MFFDKLTAIKIGYFIKKQSSLHIKLVLEVYQQKYLTVTLGSFLAQNIL